MTIQRQQRAARSGAVRTHSLDQATLVRLEFCKRFANEVLETKATGSTLVRRALSLFQGHCEALLAASGPDGDMRRCYEASQLRAANKGTSGVGLTVNQVAEAPILKSIKALKADLPKPPTVVEQLRRDVQKWQKQEAEAIDE